MKLFRRPFLRFTAIAAICGALTCHVASAQTRAIKVIVPLSPGGSVDVIARVLAEEVSRAQGLMVTVENHPGAGGQFGGEIAARAAPDGNSLLIAGSGLFVTLPHLRKLNFDALTSFEPVCELVTSPDIIAVNATSPYRTLGDLIDAARAKPGDITMASVGPGTATQIAVEMLKRAANVDITFVPFAGNAPATNALLGGHVTAALADYSVVAEHHRAGTLRALAVGSLTRVPAMPDVPSVAESGYKGYVAEIWIGLFTPAHTPSTTVSQITGWFEAALHAQETRNKLLGLGLIPNGTCGAGFAAFIRKQYDEYGLVIRDAKIKVE
jgi:tripartite-type tricarboxylate transporter receptor subunit TctC